MVDQAQRLVAARGVRAPRPALVSAHRWATRVPRALFSRVTGDAEFPSELRAKVADDELEYESNAALSFRLGKVAVALETRWDLTVPAGGGDVHQTAIRGTRAEIHVEQSAATRFGRRLSVVPRKDGDRLGPALERAVAAWRSEHPGIEVAAAGADWEIRVPRVLDTGHESHFPLVLAEFLTLVDRGGAPPALTTDTLAKYTLLAQAAARARA